VGLTEEAYRLQSDCEVNRSLLTAQEDMRAIEEMYRLYLV